MAHYPKFLDESISQALLLPSRASIISRREHNDQCRVAVVDPLKCVGYLTCVRICPYGVPRIQSDYTGVGNIIGAAYIEPAICQGCGSCAAECPARAIQIMHFKDIQTIAKSDALFGVNEIDKSFVPVESIQVRLPGD
jgi:heterodisulfide reductase subunit A-like polyferredoxin